MYDQTTPSFRRAQGVGTGGITGSRAGLPLWSRFAISLLRIVRERVFLRALSYISCDYLCNLRTDILSSALSAIQKVMERVSYKK